MFDFASYHRAATLADAILTTRRPNCSPVALTY